MAVRSPLERPFDMELDVGSIIDLSWQQFEQLAASGAAPASCVKTPFQERVHGQTETDVLITFEDDDEDAAVLDDQELDASERQGKRTHMCGMRCTHRKMTLDGQWVCTLTGRMFGQIICNGPTDNRMANAGFAFDSTPTPTPRDESGAHKRKRSLPKPTGTAELYGTASSVARNLLCNPKREHNEDERLKRALKTACRVATQARPRYNNAMQLMNLAFQSVEQAGAFTVRRKVSLLDCERIASMCAHFYSSVICKYNGTTMKRPSPVYISLALFYIFATKNLGEKLHVPILASYLPEEKSLKNLGFNISRMTQTKRWILEAVKFYVSTRQQKGQKETK